MYVCDCSIYMYKLKEYVNDAKAQQKKQKRKKLLLYV